MSKLDSAQFSKHRIKSFLARSNYNRAKTAIDHGVDESTWSRWVSGERSPSLKKLQELAPLFEMSVGEFAEAMCILTKKRKKK